MFLVINFWQTRQKHLGDLQVVQYLGAQHLFLLPFITEWPGAPRLQQRQKPACSPRISLRDVKRVVNLLESDLQVLEKTFQHHPSLCFSFLEMHKPKCTVLLETLSVNLCSLDILGKAAEKKKPQARGETDC